MTAQPPKEWIDKETGHRVVRLSEEPDSASLYFHQNAYTPDGKKLLITTPNGISTIDLHSRDIEQVISGDVKVIVAGSKTGDVYYSKDNAIHATNIFTKVTRKIGDLPPGGFMATCNCDETLLAGSINESTPPPIAKGDTPQAAVTVDGKSPVVNPVQENRLDARLQARIPMAMSTMSIQTGEVKTIYRSTDWQNHFQFSPTDPTLLMFCHEGPWHKVDRIWTIRADGSQLTKIHARTIEMEIAGHEFWSADGNTIWYDLQTPRGEDFWVAGYEVATKKRTYYHLERNEWSVHFNVSPDGSLFAGDGGGPNMVAHASDGKWIYLFRPQILPIMGRVDERVPEQLIIPGKFLSERLVNMADHDYKLEPNVTFTPDMKWIIFRSNIFGPTHVFAVEIAKA